MDKVLNMLGLARRAGKLGGGYDATVEKIKAGQARLVVTAGDISEKTLKNLKYEAGKQNVAVRQIAAGIAELGRACGIRAGIVVVNDEGFAKKTDELIEEAKTDGSRSGKVDFSL